MRGPQHSEEAVEAIIRKLKSQTASTQQRGVYGSALFARVAEFNIRPILPGPYAHEVAEGSSAQAHEANAQFSAKVGEDVGMEMNTAHGARTKKEEGKENAPESVAVPWAARSGLSAPAAADIGSNWRLQEDKKMTDEDAEGTIDEEYAGTVDQAAEVVLNQEGGTFEDVLRETKEAVEFHKRYDLWEFFEDRGEPDFWILGKGDFKL